MRSKRTERPLSDTSTKSSPQAGSGHPSTWTGTRTSAGYWTTRTGEEAIRRGKGKLVLKRDRKIINRVELTRLQRHFEACVRELDELEQSKTTRASICSITVGLIGTAFLAGATFAATHQPPLIILTILLAIPGFIGWIVPWFLYRAMVRRRTRVVDGLMERKYDEICEICEKGHQLLV